MKQVLAFVVVILVGWGHPAPVAGQAPDLINYQARLVQGSGLVNASVGLSLRLFNVPVGGASLYEDSNIVVVVDGLYSTLIGDQTNSGNFAEALTNGELWVEVAVNGMTLAPRERVASSAYALRANNAMTLAGWPAEAFATGTPVYVETDPGWSAASNGLQAQINAKADSNTVWNTFAKDADLTAEQSARAAADTALSNADTAEAALRSASDSALSNSVAAKLDSNVWAAADSTTNYLARTGGSMSGDLDMGGFSITNVANGSIEFAGGEEISAASVQDWNTAYGWGDHASAGYAGASDLSAASNGLQGQINAKADSNTVWNTFAKDADLTAEQSARAAADTALSNADTAEAALRSASDSALSNSVAAKLDSNAWAAADSTTNYLARTGGTMSGNLDMGGNSITNVSNSSIVFSDGTVLSAASAQNWNTAYGWGDHAAAGYAVASDLVSASNGLQGQINAKADSNTVWNTFAKDADLTAEQSTRAAADTALSNADAAEAALRSASDSALSNSVAAKLDSNAWAAANSTTNYLARTGGSMSGDLDMGGFSITNVANGSIEFASGEEVSAASVQDWNTAYGWGDHAAAGYAGASDLSAASNGLQGQINAKADSNTVWNTFAKTADLNAEQSARAAADTALSNADAAEAALRSASDSALSNSVAAKLDSNVWAAADSTTNSVKRTGDTMTGALALPPGGLTVGLTQLIVTAEGNVIATGTVTAAGFSGSGAALSALNAGSISAGSISDARLSGNVALLNATQTFSGPVSFSNVLNDFRGSFQGNLSGNGANITNLDAARLIVDQAPLFAWGYNGDGQTAVPATSTGVTAIAAGYRHNLALLANGTVLGWGRNTEGQTNVPGAATGVVGIAAGGYHSLALRADASVLAWGAGTNNTGIAPEYGQSIVPASATTVVAVAGGYYHSLALRADGTVVAWGAGTSDTGTSPEYGQSIVPASATTVVAIAAGGFHSLALRADGTVVAWGWNVYGEVTVPPTATSVVAVAAGGFHSLALRADGSVIAWGDVNQGQTTVPATATSVVAIAAGYTHSLALRADGSVVAWGDNTYGQTTVPPHVAGIAAIAGGGYHSLASRPSRATAQLALLDRNNNFAGTVTSAGFIGNGANLTEINAGNISAGTISDSRLSANVALLNAPQVFTGPVTFSNPSNLFNGAFTGNAAGLTNLNAASLASGSISDARLSANVALLNATQTYSGAATFSNPSNSFVGSFAGNGAGVVGVNLTNINSGGAIVTTTNPILAVQAPLAVGLHPWGVTVADVNGDGRPDIISANVDSDSVSVVMNMGAGVFNSTTFVTVGTSPYSVCAADVNADGAVDLVAANFGDSTLSVLTNTGSGAFWLSSSPAVGTGPRAVVAADVNGDGKEDLISANETANTLSILTNNGAGVFYLSSSPGAGSAATRGLTAADVNGDGKVDLVSVNASVSINRLVVLTNNGVGAFSISANLTLPGAFVSSARAAVATDVNGDGKVDLVGVNAATASLSIFTNSGAGAFALSSSPSVGGSPFAAAAADVNGDGKMDLISANSGDGTLSVLYNTGTGAYAPAVAVKVGVNPRGVAASDFNGDGAMDIVDANYGDSTISVILNYGRSVFRGSFSGDGGGLVHLNGGSIADGSIFNDALAANSVTGDNIATGAVTTAALADGAVSVAKILQDGQYLGYTLTIFDPSPAPIEYFGGGWGYSGLVFNNGLAGLGSSRIVIGAPGESSPYYGAAFVYGTDGTLLATITNPAPQYGPSYFGVSVDALGTNSIVIGAPYAYDTLWGRVGRAYVYAPNGTLLATITNPAPQNGYEGPSQFGESVAALGADRVVIGSRLQLDPSYGLVGAAFVHNTNGTLVATITNPAPQYGYQGPSSFGQSVAVLGTNAIVVGAPYQYHPSYGSVGAAFVYNTNGALLATVTNPIPQYGVQRFAASVATLGTNRILVGAPNGYVPGVGNIGLVFVYDASGNVVLSITNPVKAFGGFGASIKGWGTNVLLIGASYDSSAGSSIGRAYAYDLNGNLLCELANRRPASTGQFGITIAGIGTNTVAVSAISGSDSQLTADGRVYLYSYMHYATGLVAQAVADGSISAASLAPDVDARYVNVAGDTMTGSLTVPQISAGDISAANVTVSGTLTLGSRGVSVGDENLRIIRGSVNDSGGIFGGSGFAVVHNFTGQYTITFTTPFSAVPSVTVTPFTDEDVFFGTAFRTANLYSVNASSFVVYIISGHSTVGSGAAIYVDDAFEFIAVGPR